MDNYFGTICLCAMRYALGRQTYMPGLVQDFIKAHIAEIDFFYECGHCKNAIRKPWRCCPFCGRLVKWK